MKYELFYTKKAWSDLQDLNSIDARRIVTKLKYFIEQPDPIKHSKPLKGVYKGLFRFRIGDYRAVFSKDAKGNITILTIIRIQHRKDVY
ncbi:MAG TPA: type II toxin-antitoxin system RelE/ParE family toxin [Patescibacteria group bacterium]